MLRQKWLPGILLIVLGANGARADSVGSIFLTGTDAVSMHGDASYAVQLFTDLQDGSRKPILYLNDFGVLGLSEVAGHWVFGTDSLFGVTLSDYSGIFIAAADQCCADALNDPDLAGSIQPNEKALREYVRSGGNVAIENFFNPNWATLLGFDPAAGVLNGAFSGFGFNDHTVCADPGVPTTAGRAAGFTGEHGGPYYDYCFIHQDYSKAFFSQRGFEELIDNNGDPTQAVVLETKMSSTTSEPASLILLGSGLLGIGATMRRRLASLLPKDFRA